jgi:hypothetical protein
MKRLLSFGTVLTVITILTSNPSKASFMIEPYAGIHLGEVQSTNGSEDGHFGYGLGARAGYSFLGFMGGLEYSLAFLSVDDSANSDLDQTEIGLYAGYEFPLMLRVWGSLLLNSEVDSSNLSQDFEGDGIKLGVGFTGLPFISLNLEYAKSTYDEYGGTSLANDLEISSLIFSASLPLP